MSWSCKKCTFVNPPSQISECEICFSSPPHPSSSSATSSSSPKWSCKSCTLFNSYKNPTCHLCGTRNTVLSISSFNDINDIDDDSSVGSVFWPLRSCKRKAVDSLEDSVQPLVAKESKKAIDFVDFSEDFDQPLKAKDSKRAVDIFDSHEHFAKPLERVDSGKGVSSLKILSYNVWFREDLELEKRMKAIGDLVLMHSPDFICFQEVTRDIYDIFKRSTWWNVYHCSVSSEKAYSKAYYCMLLSKLPVKSFSAKSFSNSIMGRELCIAEVEDVGGKSFVVATSHLESPCPAPPKWDQMFSKERVEQANEALNILKRHPNVVFGGDMNWDDKKDGQYPLQDGWLDAWSVLRPNEAGWTYDTKSNQMLTGNRTLQTLIVLARALTSALANLRVQQGFPESLLMQLLKVMMHTDVEARIGAHLIFSVLLLPSSFHTNEVSSLRSRYMDQRNKRNSQTATASASITALLEKLRRGRDGTSAADHGNVVHDDKERDTVTEEWKQGCGLKTSPNFYKLSSIIDRATGSQSLTDVEPYVMKLSEDQMGQLLSAFWIQANLPDNLPSNIEAIAHSFILALIVLRIKNLKDRDNLVIRFFQLPLSLWTMLLDPSNGTLPPACQRSIFVLSVGMLVFACKIYQIHDLNDVLTLLAKSEVDPFLGISDDNQVYAKINVDLREYGTASDNQLAMSTLSELRNKISEYHQTIMNALIHNLTNFTELDADNLTVLLSETFKPDEDFVFGPQSILDQNQMTYYSQESLSVDEDFPSNSGGEDDNISEASVSDLSRFIPKMPVSPPQPHVISIGQLMESALEVASHVAGTSVSTSPLPYNAMASQCESLGTCSRKKLSNWLAFENHYTQSPDKSFLAFARNSNAALEKEAYEDGNPQVAALPRDPMKLPPASPFDNFLKAAGC